jgi:O-antigen/teichoic acid export membrane protein
MTMLAGWILSLDSALFRIVLLTALNQAFANLRSSLYGALEGRSRFGQVTIWEGIGRVAVLAVGASVLLAGGDVLHLVLAFALIEVGIFLFLLGVAGSEVGRIRLSFSFPVWRHLIVEGLPVSLNGMAILVNLRAGSVMLGLMKSMVDVGIYAAAFSVYSALANFLRSLSFGFLPSLSSSQQGDRLLFGRFFAAGFLIFFAVSLLVALTVAFIARPLIVVVFGAEFRSAVVPLLILCVAVPIITVGRLAGMTLISLGRQTKGLVASGLGAAVHVILNMMVIPRYGFAGAAGSMVVGEAIATITAFILVYKEINARSQRLIIAEDVKVAQPAVSK